MLPEWKTLRRKSKKTEIKTELYFQLAEEYTQLKKKFDTNSSLETFLLWFDMLLYPLYIFYRLFTLDFSPMYVFALMKTYGMWFDWLRLRELQQKVDNWIETVKNLGGPWISSSDPQKHVFVYADGMERILLSRSLGLSKKLGKGSK